MLRIYYVLNMALTTNILFIMHTKRSFKLAAYFEQDVSLVVLQLEFWQAQFDLGVIVLFIL